MSNIPKYDKAAPFTDPVVRCDSCHRLVVRQHIHVMGACPWCGNRKVRNVITCTDEEMAEMKKWGIDPAFIALFEEAKLPTVEELAKQGEQA